MEGGAGVAKAYRFSNLLTAVTALMSLAVIVTLLFYMDPIASLFSEDSEVHNLVTDMLPIILISFKFEALL